MFSKLNNLRRTLAFRLTLWYALVFTLSSATAFIFFYLLISTVIRDRTDEELKDHISRFASIAAGQGVSAVHRAAVLDAQAAGEKKLFFRFLYRNGSVFSSSNMSYWQDIPIDREALQQLVEQRRVVLKTVDIPGRSHSVRTAYGFISASVILQLGQSMENTGRFLEAFRRLFISTMAGLILFSALIGWFMAKRALSGVEAVTKTARRISMDSLDQRVPLIRGGREIAELATTFNSMLERIQRLVSGMKEISDNIAHDLKSPITRIRGLAEVTLTTGASREDFTNLAANTIGECDRLLEMINTMLVISKTEAGVGELKMAPFDLAASLRDACELFRASAEDVGLELMCDIGRPFAFRGDIRMIQRMFSNVLDNAIKYTPSPGSVTVSLETASPGWISIGVTDSGIGIDSADLPRIFDRFFRCDQSRSREGTGLGLSLSKAVAVAHGGRIEVESAPGAGSTFRIFLPSTDNHERSVAGLPSG